MLWLIWVGEGEVVIIYIIIYIDFFEIIIYNYIYIANVFLHLLSNSLGKLLLGYNTIWKIVLLFLFEWFCIYIIIYYIMLYVYLLLYVCLLMYSSLPNWFVFWVLFVYCLYTLSQAVVLVIWDGCFCFIGLFVLSS